MIEWLNTQVAYWHWIVLGLLLAGLEIFLPSFVLIWFGSAALCVGLLMLLVPMSLTAQLLVWVVLSLATLVVWQKFVAPRMRDRTLAGLSREAIIGQTGIVIRHDAGSGRGLLKFPAPILGSDEWNFIFDGKLASGDRVTVTDLSGNAVIVRPQ